MPDKTADGQRRQFLTSLIATGCAITIPVFSVFADAMTGTNPVNIASAPDLSAHLPDSAIRDAIRKAENFEADYGDDVYLDNKSTPGFPAINGGHAIALVGDTGTVVQFVSFGTAKTPTVGPAAGMTSVAESRNDTPHFAIFAMCSGSKIRSREPMGASGSTAFTISAL